ncbi:MAG: STAS domain-containing protein [Capsulimonadaceae bacterium]|nr:STAS domain-containing protein [Capsulimonadaceae bacterium]
MDKVQLTSFAEIIESVPVLHVAGEIDIFTAPDFKDAIADIAVQGYTHIVIDMQHVAFMDSSGFGTLLSASKPLRPVGGSLSMVNCNDSITRMLNITRLSTIIPIYATVAEAIEAAHSLSEQPVPA